MPREEAEDAAALDAQIDPRRRLYVIALALLVACEGLAALGIVSGPHRETGSFLESGSPFLAQSLLAALVVLAFTRPSQGELVATIAAGAALEAWHGWLRAGQPGGSLLFAVNFGGGFGLAALAACAVSAMRARGLERRRAIARLMAAGLLPTFMLLSRQLLELTRALHPFTYDLSAFVADRALGFDPTFFFSRAARKVPALYFGLTAVYFALPAAAAIVQVAELRGPSRLPSGARRDLGVAFVVAGLVGGALYNVLPVLGPQYEFGAAFPWHAPDAARVTGGSSLGPPDFRNAIPSLHTIWALLIYWHARPYGRGLRIFAGAWLAATLAATIVTGEHYVVDLIVSIPVAVAIQASLSTTVPWTARARWLPVASAVFGFAVWSFVLVGFPGLFRDARSLAWGLFAVTIALPLWLERDLRRAMRDQPELAPPSPRAEHAPTLPGAPALLWLTAASAFAALIYGVAFAKSLDLAFGSTATANAAVLASCLGAAALGSWQGARLARRTAAPLRLAAGCEAGVALSCAFAPVGFRLLRAAYMSLAQAGEPGRPSLLALQVALAAPLILPPAALTGAKLSLFAKELMGERAGMGRTVGALHGAQALGEAMGALVAGYALAPLFGLERTAYFAGAVSLVAALVTLRLASRTAAREPLAPPDAPAARAGRGILVASGALALGIAGVYRHLLAVVVGSSTFAFSAMLFCALGGLGAGLFIGRGWLRRGRAPTAGFSLAQALVAVCVLGGVFAWSRIPGYFASFQDYPLARGFGERELVRLVGCALLTVPSALFIGAGVPLAIECVGRGSRDPAFDLGRVPALGLFGGLMGLVVGDFVLLPNLGSLRTLESLGCASLALALLPLRQMRREVSEGQRRAVLGVAALAALLLTFQPAAFDFTLLASGANVRFVDPARGRVIDAAESVESGITTLATRADGASSITSLLTNGIFRGDDRALDLPIARGLFPLLHTEGRNSALVIGLGTGLAARVPEGAGFETVYVAGVSRAGAALIARHFGEASAHVLDRPNVHVSQTSGRDLLLTRPRRYDVIAIDLASPWAADAAPYYDEELYRLAKTRLADGGVLAQRLPLGDLEAVDCAAVLAAARAVYAQVWLYVAGTDGVLVACDGDCSPRAATLARLEAASALRAALDRLGGARALLRDRVLTPAAVDAFLGRAGAPIEELASTDDNLVLEYAAARVSAGDREPSALASVNAKVFASFTPASELEGTKLGPGAL